jgi:hypothetical protein
VLFHPQPPRPESSLGLICARRGYAVVTDPEERFDAAIFWTTRTIRRPPPGLAAVASHARVLNFDCRDIGKRHVERVFSAVFGYGSFLSPRTMSGRCVRKSNLNARHDGVVVRCPVRRVRRDCVYQRLIDNRVGVGQVEDLRTPVIGGHIPFVYMNRKPLHDRFDGEMSVRRVAAERVYAPSEIRNIQRFCAAMGLDYAELDVLRDRRDRRIFIVDANPTPWTPDNMSITALAAALDRQAQAFDDLIARTSRGRRR